MLASLPGLLVSVLILLTFRQQWIILDDFKKIFSIQRSEAGHGQGDSSGWGEQAEGRLQEVDHGISQEAAGHILLTHDDDSSACR